MIKITADMSKTLSLAYCASALTALATFFSVFFMGVVYTHALLGAYGAVGMVFFAYLYSKARYFPDEEYDEDSGKDTMGDMI